MAGEIKLPVIGSTSKRTLYLGGGAAVLVMGVLWWRKRNAAPAAAATGTSTTDTTGLDTTGLDTLGLAGGGGALVGPSVSNTVTAATTNSQWFANAETALSGVVDPGALATDLGAYLTGNAVTTDQETVIDQAIAAEGWPPVSGPNGYPPAIRTQPSSGQTSPQGPGTYIFKLTNDTSPDKIYVGVPGVGWYWVPGVPLLAQYLKVRHPLDLGTISQADAQTRFGTQKPWSSIGLTA